MSPNSSYIQGILGDLGSEYGFITTSTIRSPSYNSEIGGVANSQHITGTARDYSIRNKTPSQVSEFIRKLQGSGFEAFRHKTKTGVEHVHAELPPGKETVACPNWIPKNLCSSFRSLQKFSDYVTPAGKVIADEAEKEAANWTNYITRTALFGIALILIAIALIFAFKDEAVKMVPTLKAVT